MLRNCGICLCALLACGFIYSALQLDPEAVNRFADNILHLVQYQATMAREQDRTELLEASHNQTMEHIEAKQALAREVLQGRLSLRAAATRFDELSSTSQIPWDYLAE